jgi:superfamily II DNA or RNA helicase
MKLTLRDYQQQAVEDVRNAYRSCKDAPVLALPTGGGKTVIFSYITESATARGNNTLILVHRRELISQTSETLTALGVDHGVIAANWPKTNAPVQVASVQTLVRRLEKCDFDPDLIIIDEAHHAVAGTWAQILSHFSDAKLLGVTATPMRLDGKGLKDFFDELVIGPSVAELTQRGFLAPAQCFSIPQRLDRKRLRKSRGDFVGEDVVQTLEDLKINGNAVNEYKKHCPGKPAIVFCMTKKHAEMMAKKFSNAGFRSEFLHSDVDPTTRKELIENLGNGKLDILTSVNVISEGTDIPVVTAAILLRPTESEAMYLQQVGRVLRPAKGKDRAIIIDCVGNVHRFGLPTDERNYTLEGKEKAEEAPPLKTCPDCYAIVPINTEQCPECGHVFAAKPKPAPKEILEVELVEVGKKYTQWERKTLINCARTLGDFYSVAKRLGYKPGWAWMMWQDFQSEKGHFRQSKKPQQTKEEWIQTFFDTPANQPSGLH